MSMDWFNDDGIFMPMLNDTGRNIFYKTAIEAAVPGKTVCDIGTGTGFLSVLAAHAGAKHVIAVERDLQRYQYTKSIIEKDRKIFSTLTSEQMCTCQKLSTHKYLAKT